MFTSLSRVVDDRGRHGEIMTASASGAVLALLFALVLVSLQGCKADDPVVEARALIRQGRLEPAIELLREALEVQGDDSEVLYLYGRALSISGRPSLAEWSLRKAMEDPEWRVPAAMQVAYGALASHSFDESIAAANVVLEVEPDHIDALLMRANSNVESRRFAEEGLADTDRVLELDPTNVKAFRPRVLALLDLERFEEAGEELEALGVLIEEGHGDDKTDVWHCATMAVFTSDGGDLELAEEKFEVCRERFPGDPSVVTPAVEFYDRQQKFSESIAVLREALEVERSSKHRFWVGLAARLRVLGPEGGKKALEIMRAAPLEVEDSGEQARRWVELADFLKQQGGNEEALEALEQAIEVGGLTPRNSPDLYFATAELYLRVGNQERALELADSFHAETYRAMIQASVAHARGDYEEALEAYDEASRLWPTNAFARYHAARAAMALGQVDRALEEYRHSARISQSETDAPVAAAKILVARREYRSALEALGQRRGPWLEEAGLLHVEIAAASSEPSALESSLQQLATQHPESYGRGVSRAVATLLGAGDAQRARAVISRIPGALWSHPSSAPALRATIQLSTSEQEIAATQEVLSRLLEGYPANAPLQEVEAFRLFRSGASTSDVRAAIDKALELDPTYGLAWLTLAQSSAEWAVSERLEALQNAATTVPSEASPQFIRACQDVVAQEPDAISEVIQLVDRRLAEFPIEGMTALFRVRLASRVGDEAAVRKWSERARQLGYELGADELGREASE